MYLPEGGGPPPCGTRPRRRLPLRNLSIRRVPRRHHAFALCPKEPYAAPLLLCQADDAECFLRWTRTLAVELMKQTPLGDVRFLDILRITETPHPDDVDESKLYNQQQPDNGREPEPEEIERLKDLCQRGSATVTERRRLFEVLGGGRSTACNRNAVESHRSQLSSSRSCTSSEDLGNSVMKYPSLPRIRPKRAKSLHDLPSDFPVSCTVEGGVPIPISIVSQLRLYFERISQNGSVAERNGWSADGGEENKNFFEKERRLGESMDSQSDWISRTKSNCTKGQIKKTGRSLSYSCEGNRKFSHDSYPSYGSDNVFLNNVSQKLYKHFYPVCEQKVKEVEDDNDIDGVVLNMYTKEMDKRKINRSGYINEEMASKSYNNVKVNPIITKLNSNQVINSSSPFCFNKLSATSHPYQSSPPHSLSSDSSTFSFQPLGASMSSSCSSLSVHLSTPSSSPPSQMSQKQFILSSIKKQASESEETIWNLQEEMARLDRQRMAAQRDQNMFLMGTCPEKLYSDLEVKLQEEELKLDTLYKEAEKVLKSIEESVKQEVTTSSEDP
ncbi:hypothetical protein J437_LFUL005194 [Ladona fulva]|uniref:Uncharacterized protein n=1 Tax=Ladona fulva TaxID=123851 RepID=A0A8K0KNP8_LADFU|nr:hypothetical protein J437_LFUL005194 [Ladona fulva]